MMRSFYCRWHHCALLLSALRLRSTSWKLAKCMQSPVVYVSNYSWCIHNNYLLQKLHKCTSPNSLAMLKPSVQLIVTLSTRCTGGNTHTEWGLNEATVRHPPTIWEWDHTECPGTNLYVIIFVSLKRALNSFFATIILSLRCLSYSSSLLCTTGRQRNI